MEMEKLPETGESAGGGVGNSGERLNNGYYVTAAYE
jgi:hypothetical protein